VTSLQRHHITQSRKGVGWWGRLGWSHQGSGWAGREEIQNPECTVFLFHVRGDLPKHMSNGQDREGWDGTTFPVATSTVVVVWVVLVFCVVDDVDASGAGYPRRQGVSLANVARVVAPFSTAIFAAFLWHRHFLLNRENLDLVSKKYVIHYSVMTVMNVVHPFSQETGAKLEPRVHKLELTREQTLEPKKQ